jgi:translation initiation factor IF-2
MKHLILGTAGHVDHGKTKLLDAIRKSDIVSTEAGGITQHIGAYEVTHNGRKIVFLDTPGHEAFTQMRARGAIVTDIVVLVVSAADGVMPQTIEAINHAQAAEVPIIVAINKIDLEAANVDRVKNELSQYGLNPEDWGGSTTMCQVSALKGIGLEELLEMIILQSEIMELKANPTCRARGTIIEAKVDKGRGAVATVLVQNGTLAVGDTFVTGVDFGKVRAMFNDKGEPVKEVGPSSPVEVLGLGGLPLAGDVFVVVNDERVAKQISIKLRQMQRERELRRTHHVTLADLHHRIEEGTLKEINIIVKADVQGSVGALCESLIGLPKDKVKVNIIHSAAGRINGSDVMLASASDALIIGFHVDANEEAIGLSKKENVEIRTYQIIYDVINDVRAAMEGMLEAKYEEELIGKCEVRNVFYISRIGTIAGCYVTDGKFIRSGSAKAYRDNQILFSGKIHSLKRFKDDIKEVFSGYECGIGLEGFDDIEVGDTIECYMIKEVAQTL